MQKFLTSFSLSLICIFFSLNNISNANEVNIYTSRHYDSDDALYEKFKNNTGIKVNIISGKGDALMERLKSEANNSPADIFLTTDAGNLWKIQKPLKTPSEQNRLKNRLPQETHVFYPLG